LEGVGLEDEMKRGKKEGKRERDINRRGVGEGLLGSIGVVRTD